MPIVSGGGGGGTTQLFTTTLAAPAATIDSGAAGFSTALGTLLVFAYLRGTNAAITVTASVTVNANVGANYDYEVLSGQNVTAAAANSIGGAAWLPLAAGGNAAASVFTALQLTIPAYGATTGFKSGVMVGGVPDQTAGLSTAAQLFQCSFRGTAAISRVTITPASGNWATGSSLVIAAI